MTDMSVDIRDVGPLHEALLKQAAAEADDERVRQAWLESERREQQAKRAALRAEWVQFHQKLERNHRSIADEHKATAQRLLREGARG